jgi:hypothetical protein
LHHEKALDAGSGGLLNSLGLLRSLSSERRLRVASVEPPCTLCLALAMPLYFIENQMKLQSVFSPRHKTWRRGHQTEGPCLGCGYAASVMSPVKGFDEKKFLVFDAAVCCRYWRWRLFNVSEGCGASGKTAEHGSNFKNPVAAGTGEKGGYQKGRRQRCRRG